MPIVNSSSELSVSCYIFISSLALNSCFMFASKWETGYEVHIDMHIYSLLLSFYSHTCYLSIAKLVCFPKVPKQCHNGILEQKIGKIQQIFSLAPSRVQLYHIAAGRKEEWYKQEIFPTFQFLFPQYCVTFSFFFHLSLPPGQMRDLRAGFLTVWRGKIM